MQRWKELVGCVESILARKKTGYEDKPLKDHVSSHSRNFGRQVRDGMLLNKKQFTNEKTRKSSIR